MGEEPSHIDAAIADLEGWQERISAAIETLRALRIQGGSLPGGPPPSDFSRGTTNGDISHDAFFQMTVPDAAEKYLASVKKTKPTAEVAAALLKGGLKSSAKRFPAMVNTVLSRESRFVRVNNEWGLAAWYPGMRKTTAARKQVTTGEPQPIREPATKKQTTGNGFGPDSIMGRTLSLLKAHPEKALDAPTIAQQIGVKNVPSVSAALAALFAQGLIARPKKGQYQPK